MAESNDQERKTGQNFQAPPKTPAASRNASTRTQGTTSGANPTRPTAHNDHSKRSNRMSERPNSKTDNIDQPTKGRPQFSLAGNYAPPNHQPRFVAAEYYDLNPNYQKPRTTPLWGLAKPLPRVVRPGMRRGREDGSEVVENKRAEHDEPGRAEAIPQLGMIESQRRNDGNEEGRGYGHLPKPGERESHRSVQKQESGTGSLDRYGTPFTERNDLMDQWMPPESPSGGCDLGDQRTGLSDVQERPSQPPPSTSYATTQNGDFVNQPDWNNYDLEAGQKMDDEWSLTSQEADHYMREEKENFNKWSIIRARFREPLAECLATMVAVLIGVSTNLAAQTSNDQKGSYLSTNWAWGFGITIGVYLAGGISGGHLNPAISLTLCIFRGFPLRKACVYILAQTLGAFFAGLIAYGIYKDAIVSYDTARSFSLSTGGTGQSFYTQPSNFATPAASFFNEFVATAILSCAILALGDDSNAPPGAGMHALIVGFLATVLTMAFGYTTSACLNPARDFGPRLATAVVGYGGEVFTVANAWWIYGAWGATISGAFVGALFYDAAIFVGGESPVNYPSLRRKQTRKKARDTTKRRWWDVKKDVQMGKDKIKSGFGKEG